jgi:hypothetical protein
MRLMSSIDTPLEIVDRRGGGGGAGPALAITREALRELSQEVEEREAVGIRFIVYTASRVVPITGLGGSFETSRLGQSGVLTASDMQGLFAAGGGAVASVPCDMGDAHLPPPPYSPGVGAGGGAAPPGQAGLPRGHIEIEVIPIGLSASTRARGGGGVEGENGPPPTAMLMAAHGQQHHQLQQPRLSMRRVVSLRWRQAPRVP